MGAPTRLRTRVTLVVAAGALLVAAGVALLLANTLALRDSSESTARAETYLLRVVDLERLVVDAETGLRGDLITNKKLFLAPLDSAEAQLPATIRALRAAAARDHAYEPQSGALIAAARSYMGVYVPQVLGLAAHDLPAARSLAVTLEGKHEVDAIRGRVTTLEQLLANSDAQRQRTASHTSNRSIAEAIIVLVLLTLLTAAVGSYLARLAVARDRAREQSERTSRTLQTSSLPSAVPTIPGCELATRFIPGGGRVSGDFYDVFEIHPDGWGLMIGDVTGKGVAAAATTAMARWTLRSALARGAAPEDALRFLNEAVIREGREGRFITAACLKLRLASDSAQIDVACAGHPAPILVPRAGPASAVDARGDLLGMERTIRLHAIRLALRPGDGLVAYTDGVTDQGLESRVSPEQALSDRRSGADAEQLAASLESLARHPAGRHPDDIAILALRFLGQSADERPMAAVLGEQETEQSP